ncbi:stalk domain-containing protein [Paenibacillus sp. HGF5]|uniref:stalk domain-containing protein n=1 Tax=Paenibacillus sp. HGF5 TaxID=908341 RepID=UPI000563F160|nr:stalk domain-containing protein [Paenibacillus sp. HGF5]
MKKKYILLLSAATMLGGMTIGVGAAPALEKISANLNWGIKYEVNGEDWVPKDQSGKKLATITYNNSNYIPVKAISEALGSVVEYDSKNQKIIIGEKPDTTIITKEGIKINSTSFTTRDKQYTEHNGKDYGSGIVMREINNSEKTIILEPKGKYKVLDLSLLPINIRNDISVTIYNGKTKIKELMLSPKDIGQHIVIDIKDANQIEVNVKFQKDITGDDTIFLTGTYK